MKDFVKIDNTIILEHQGYEKITGKLEDGSSTLLEMLRSKAQNFPTDKFVGAINKFLETEYITCSVLSQCSHKISNYISTITKSGEIVGIASSNRPEWLIAEHAIYYSNCINSPLFTTFKEDALSYILSITQMRVLIAAPSFAKMIVEKVVGFISSELIKLEYIILMENDQTVANICISKGIKVISFNDILFGDLEVQDPFYFDLNFTICSKAERYFHVNLKSFIEPLDELRGLPKPEDLASICFTSGTTGIPKGVQLTHRNFIAQIESYKLSADNYEIFLNTPTDVYFSYLPLSHVLERAAFYCISSLRVPICCFRGDKSKIAEDLRIVKPTLLACVPKVLQSFYQKIEDEISKKKFYERFIYRSAVSLKIFLQRFGIRNAWIIDEKIFKKVSAGFGGRIREFLCGGAAADPYLLKYFMAVLGSNMYQGYGQTEGLGANSLSTKSMNDLQTIGVPFPATKFKLVSIEPNSTSPEKALLLKGHSIMKGYFIPSDEILNKLLETGKFRFSIENIKEKPFDEDGWLITGDVVIYKDKKVYIVGRSKDLVKLNNGEYISPENIENKLRETDLIKDVFVSKIKGEDKFVALVSAPGQNTNLLQVANYLKSSIDELISKKVIPVCIEMSRFAVVNQNFLEIDDGVLFTPTLKKKRFIFSQRFESIISKSLLITDVLNENSFKILDSSVFSNKKLDPK